MIELERGEHRFSVYDQLLPTRPLGLFCWCFAAEWKDLKYKLVADE